MKKFIALFISTLLLSGCVHKLVIEQGNIITQDNLNRLQLGMTQDQVANRMGTPLVINTFADNRMDYVYMVHNPYRPLQKQSYTMIFTNGRLAQIKKNP